jgi:hypothetical protein
MQILKSPLVLGVATTLCAAPLTLAAAAPPQAQSPIPSQNVAQPAQQSPPAAVPAQSVASPSSADAIERAREAMRQKMEQLETGQTTPLKEPEAIAKARAAMRQKMAQLNRGANAGNSGVAAGQSGGGIMSAQPAPNQATSMAGATGNYEPLPAPPPAVSAIKQQRLDQLLQQYRADQISPEQYQAERAKILSGK